jgi:hypothetical protein
VGTPDLDDYRGVLRIMPAVLLLGALAALVLRETKTRDRTVWASELTPRAAGISGRS